ncbi:MAG: Uncharacterised protein [Hyphomonas sp. TMED17]|nr:MAG: Uncharacterised protein [Hyphomonas sp. TMED17]
MGIARLLIHCHLIDTRLAGIGIAGRNIGIDKKTRSSIILGIETRHNQGCGISACARHRPLCPIENCNIRAATRQGRSQTRPGNACADYCNFAALYQMLRSLAFLRFLLVPVEVHYYPTAFIPFDYARRGPIRVICAAFWPAFRRRALTAYLRWQITFQPLPFTTIAISFLDSKARLGKTAADRAGHRESRNSGHLC